MSDSIPTDESLSLPPPLIDDSPADVPALASFSQQVAIDALQVDFPAEAAASTSIHAYSENERRAFVEHINKVLADQVDLSAALPIDPNSDAIFGAVKDGIILCKLINWSVPRTIDENKIVKYFRDEKSKMYHQLTNLNLSIVGAKKIGAVVVNLGAEDLMAGKPYLVFGLLWQIIKIGLLKEVSVQKHPELLQLQNDGEEDMANLPAEALLLKWMNYHLKKTSGGAEFVSNFAKDVKDSSAYIRLMHRMAPDICTLEALNEPDLLKRAEMMLSSAELLGCRTFVTPEDVVAGNEKLNLAFVASMFHKHTGMLPIAEEMEEENQTLQDENANLRETIEALERKVKYIMNDQATKDNEIAQLTSEKTELSKQVDQSKFEREELALKVHSIFEVNEKLQSQISDVTSEKQLVENTKNQLSQKYESVLNNLMSTTNELQKERIHLETSEFCGASLANDLEELRSRQEKMEYLIEHLKIERQRSDMHVERLRILYNSFASTEDLCQAIYRSLALDTIGTGASKMGYLTKKARNGNSWKYRFFVLRDNFLFYYKSDKDVKGQPSGAIRVDDAVLRFAENPTRKDLKDQWLLCIDVPNQNETTNKQLSFYIAGEDHELEGWKTQIQTAAGWWTKKSSFSSMKNRNAAKLASFS